MPFKSKAQARFMFSQKPKLAKEFAAKTPSIKVLPNKVKSPKAKASGFVVPGASKYSGKGTRARLNTAAQKNFFGTKSSFK